ncbi:MAG: hypothetical protein ACTIJ6_11160, partial [Leucobacter sp.]
SEIKSLTRGRSGTSVADSNVAAAAGETPAANNPPVISPTAAAIAAIEFVFHLIRLSIFAHPFVDSHNY